LLEHPARYLRTWDGTPRSLFLSFAHVLELPLASVVGWFVPGDSGLRTLCVFEALCGGAALWLLGWLVRFWRERSGGGRGALRAAFLAQLTIACTLAFWKLGSSGQEKVLALATQLLFLGCFWRALSGPRAAPAGPARGGGVAWSVAATLALAILCHLTGAVLVPFAALALLFLPAAWLPQRARVVRGVAIGAVGAGLVYYTVAALTTGASSPAGFFEYLTFFHRASGNNFFEPTGAVARGHARLVRAALGLTSFFTGGRAARSVAALVLLLAAVWPLLRRRGTAGEAGAAGFLSTLQRQALLLGALWAAHFLFFEPQNFESWTLVAALLVLVAAVSLPAGRIAWAGALLPAFLVVANQPHYVANHRVPPVESYRRIVGRHTRPNDIVMLTGGQRNAVPLEGSLAMRYYLATQPQRTIISLYDVMGFTQLEYWGRPFGSPAALQAAIDSGRRVYVPGFLKSDLERANASGLVRITTAARGDSLLEVTRIEAGTAR